MITVKNLTTQGREVIISKTVREYIHYWLEGHASIAMPDFIYHEYSNRISTSKDPQTPKN